MDKTQPKESENISNLLKASAERNQEIKVGEFFGNYRIQEELGHGGMGAVYKAIDVSLERTVALKVISLHGVTEKRVKRFLQEAKAIAQLKHPNIVGIFEVSSYPQYYFTMEYLEGKNLKNTIQKGSFSPLQSALIAKQIAQALHTAHQKGIIHRDIKPSNIMIDKNGTPKLMDFGLSKVMDLKVALSDVGETVGTPAYMSPEQARGKDIDPKSDVYSLGATLYEMLTGKAPFQGNSFVILNKIFHESPPSIRELNPKVPIKLEAICLRSMEKDPRKRYQSARSFAKDLNNFLENKSIIACPTPTSVRLKKFFFAYRWFIFISILFFLTASLAASMGYMIGKKKFQNQSKQEKALEQNLKTELKNQKDNWKSFQQDTLSLYSHLASTKGSLVYNPHFISSCEKFITPLLIKNIFAKQSQENKEKILDLHVMVYDGMTEQRLPVKESSWLDFYNSIIDQNPKLAIAYGNRGYLYYHTKEYNKAIKDIQKAIRMDLQNARYYFILGNICDKIGNPRKAALHWKKSAELGYKAKQEQLIEEKKKFPH